VRIFLNLANPGFSSAWACLLSGAGDLSIALMETRACERMLQVRQCKTPHVRHSIFEFLLGAFEKARVHLGLRV
jgi:hypothetical protein